MAKLLTIPMMLKRSFDRRFAGGIEAAASSGGMSTVRTPSTPAWLAALAKTDAEGGVDLDGTVGLMREDIEKLLAQLHFKGMAESLERILAQADAEARQGQARVVRQHRGDDRADRRRHAVAGGRSAGHPGRCGGAGDGAG